MITKQYKNKIMKKLHLIIAVLFMLAIISCKNNEEKTIDSIEQYLKSNLRDYTSYQSVSFSAIDTLKKADTTEDRKSVV